MTYSPTTDDVLRFAREYFKTRKRSKEWEQ